MPPQLALLICSFLILYLFWTDRSNSEGVSKAICVPFIWMFLSASRYVSQWMNLASPDFSTDPWLEGSPLDRNVFSILILAGIYILLKRGINWKAILIENKWVFLYFAFGALSFLWSDFPYVSFKRWIKALGNVIMVLIILTEDRPYNAIGLLLRRLSFILIPLSVVFVKYYPHLGRSYHMGNPMFTGVSGTKNGLGAICLLSGIYFSWNLIIERRKDTNPAQKTAYTAYIIILPMIAWLFYMANSATSFACMLIALGLFFMASLPAVAKRANRIIHIVFGVIIFIGILDITFGVKDTIIAMLGRRPDLTTRIPMWEHLLSMVQNPLIGTGYESFWLGDRLLVIQARWGQLIQAHNGYLEVYLNLGIIGILIVISWAWSGLNKIKVHLSTDYPSAVMRFGFLVVVLFYNYPEATFYGVSNMWLLLLIAIMNPHVCHYLRPPSTST